MESIYSNKEITPVERSVFNLEILASRSRVFLFVGSAGSSAFSLTISISVSL
jgi:hypothetical protein